MGMRQKFRTYDPKEYLKNCNYRKNDKNVPDPFGIRLVLMCSSMCHFIFFSELYQVKEGEYKYPNQIHKVPIQPNFFDHFIASPSLISSQDHIKEDNDIKDNSRKYVKTVKSCNKEKEICK